MSEGDSTLGGGNITWDVALLRSAATGKTTERVPHTRHSSSSSRAGAHMLHLHTYSYSRLHTNTYLSFRSSACHPKPQEVNTDSLVLREGWVWCWLQREGAGGDGGGKFLDSRNPGSPCVPEAHRPVPDLTVSSAGGECEWFVRPRARAKGRDV